MAAPTIQPLVYGLLRTASLMRSLTEAIVCSAPITGNSRASTAS